VGNGSQRTAIRTSAQVARPFETSLSPRELGAVTLISQEMKNVLDRITGLTRYYKKFEFVD
jgi:hypothetical protein